MVNTGLRPQISISSFTPSSVLSQGGLASMTINGAGSGLGSSPYTGKLLGIPTKVNDFLRVPPRPNPLLKSAAKTSEEGWHREKTVGSLNSASLLLNLGNL